MTDILEIDGSILEGGGQILRNSISFSAILGIPLRVTKIRAGRKKPGLAMQHLKGIELVAQMCQASVKGVTLGSTEIEFLPGKLRGGHYEVNTHTAGSISLLLQVGLPCALLADGPVTLVLKGGTNADMAPQIDYMTEVFRRYLHQFGADFELEILKRGYFPKGGGCVKVHIKPVHMLHSVNIIDRGSLISAYGWSYVAGSVPTRVAFEMGDAAKRELQKVCEIDIECYHEEKRVAPDSGSGIILVAETSTGCVLAGDAVGKPGGTTAHAVGSAAGRALFHALRSKVCLDTHMQDQVILYMALGSGRSTVRVGEITLHASTAAYIAEKVAKVKFEMRHEGAHHLIVCDGLGFTNEAMLGKDDTRATPRTLGKRMEEMQLDECMSPDQVFTH